MVNGRSNYYVFNYHNKMTKEIQQMFVELNKQLADVVILVRQVNERSEEALSKVRDLVDLVVPPTPDDLR